MLEDIAREVETIVNALLQVSDKVVEVSKDHVLTRIWDSPLSTIRNSGSYIGKKIIDIRNDSINRQCDDLITKSFSSKENNSIQYSHADDYSLTTYSVRILPIHPDKNFLLLVITNLSMLRGIELVEDKWKLALDAAGDGMWDLNLQTGKISFSDKWHDIFGYSQSGISTWDDWVAKIHPDDQARYKQISQGHIAGETPYYSVEQRFLCKDGSYKWILSRGVIVSTTSDGKPLRALGTHHDINERKMAEEALKISKDTFASVFDHSGIGIALISPGGKWLDVNNVICQMTGYSKEELLNLHHFDVTYPADRDIDRSLIDQMLEKGISTYTIEKRYVSKQNKIVLGLLTVSLVWNSDNTPKFFITQVIDITKKKEFENEIRKKNVELEAAKAKLINKISQLERLNNIIANHLKEPADDIKLLTGMLLAKNKVNKPDSINVLYSALSREEALARISENSNAIINTLTTIMASADRNNA